MLLGSAAVALVALSVGALALPLGEKQIPWLSVAAGCPIVALVVIAKTFRKIEFTQFVSKDGRALLDVARSGPQRASFHSFVEAADRPDRRKPGRCGQETNRQPVHGISRPRFLRQAKRGGNRARSSDSPVWGILMEMVVPNGMLVTLLSLADGTSSVYFGSGGVVIGGQSNENVRQAAVGFLATANELYRHMAPADTWPSPLAGRIAFFRRTDLGLLAADVAESELRTGRHPLSPLYVAGHVMLAEFRKISQAKQASGV